VVLFPGGIVLEVWDGLSELVPVELVRVSIVVAAKATLSVFFYFFLNPFIFQFNRSWTQTGRSVTHYIDTSFVLR